MTTRDGRALVIDRQRRLLGRGADADLRLDESRVSTRHAEVWLEEGAAWVRDLGAKNGTTVGGAPLTGPVRLEEGAELVLGGVVALRVERGPTVRADELPARVAEALAGLPAGSARAAVEGAIGELLVDAMAMRAMAHAAPTLAAALARGDLLQTLVDVLADMSGAATVWAFRWAAGGPADGSLRFEEVACHGEPREVVEPGEISTSLLGWVARSGRARWSDDAGHDADLREARSIVRLGLRSVGCVPLGARGAVYLADGATRALFGPTVRARVEAVVALAGGLLSPPEDTASPSATQAPSLPGVVGRSAAMHRVAQSVRGFAPMPWPALILGETGTGKELIAQAIHRLSGREGELVAVNCGAIPPELAESTLFGHERGAFTGAERRHLGVFDQVGVGTLFLDEVGELPPALQVKLLRVLQEGTFTPVGGVTPRRFRGRVVAATHRAIEDDDRFREDLYFRLSVCVVHLPPLRERASDIPELARYLLDKALSDLPGGLSLTLSPEAMSALRSRRWRGNVRELENTLRRAIASCVSTGSATVRPEHLGLPDKPRAGPWDTEDLLEATELFQRERVRSAMEAAGGNRTQAAATLGVNRQWLYRLLQRWPEHPWGSDG